MNKSCTSHVQVKVVFSNKSYLLLGPPNYYPGWWVGGWWFHSVMRLRLSQPSLAGVGAGAELGNKGRNRGH